MNDIKDILRSRQADFDGEEAKVRRFKAYLDERYGAGNCALRMQQQQLIIHTKTAALASHLRHRLPELTRQAQETYEDPGLKVRILIGV